MSVEEQQPTSSEVQHCSAIAMSSDFGLRDAITSNSTNSKPAKLPQTLYANPIIHEKSNKAKSQLMFAAKKETARQSLKKDPRKLQELKKVKKTKFWTRFLRN